MRKIARSQQYEQAFHAALFEKEPWLNTLVRMGAQVILQKAIEEEVTEFLEREHYRHTQGDFRGHRNGYEKKKMATGEGPIELGIPQVRGVPGERFQSRILESWRGRSTAVEQMIPALYVKGLSQRDTEGVMKQVLGNPNCSKSTVSRICQVLGETFAKWKNRDLSGYGILYLFLDAIYLPVRQDSREKEGVLAAYGITWEGKKVLLHLGLGERESYEAWLGFLHDLTQRGLTSPLLVLMDGNAGLKKAVREVFPWALRQRCLVHKMRNILARVPRKRKTEIQKLVQGALSAKTYEEAKRLCQELISRWKSLYPSAMECLEKDLDECLTYLRFPKEHQKRIRTTNLLERLFGEGRRRTKVIPRFPTEGSALSLVYSTLVDASQSWRGVPMTPQIQTQLESLWQQQNPQTQPEQMVQVA